MSGWSCTGRRLKPQMPPTSSATNIMITGTGFRIDHVTKFMARPLGGR